jgi:hypothetical protein
VISRVQLTAIDSRTIQGLTSVIMAAAKSTKPKKYSIIDVTTKMSKPVP